MRASKEIWAARNSDVLRVVEVSTGHSRNEWAEETGDPRETPPINGIVRHDSHLRKSSDPAGDSTRFALVGGEQANRSATAAPCSRLSSRRCQGFPRNDNEATFCPQHTLLCTIAHDATSSHPLARAEGPPRRAHTGKTATSAPRHWIGANVRLTSQYACWNSCTHTHCPNHELPTRVPPPKWPCAPPRCTREVCLGTLTSMSPPRHATSMNLKIPDVPKYTYLKAADVLQTIRPTQDPSAAQDFGSCRNARAGGREITEKSRRATASPGTIITAKSKSDRAGEWIFKIDHLKMNSFSGDCPFQLRGCKQSSYKFSTSCLLSDMLSHGARNRTPILRVKANNIVHYSTEAVNFKDMKASRKFLILNSHAVDAGAYSATPRRNRRPSSWNDALAASDTSSGNPLNADSSETCWRHRPPLAW
ncbi:hypothetical protein PR048_023161 [Dryococelus australis]|uniref:Uncharacterized protein n=1 Tax=Dryococelus australis TaxID=614101 RepID=A0ABQ9GTA0_9NEOP|nr:hypothetical protein PR048_023161 [Dryococelus australis]